MCSIVGAVLPFEQLDYDQPESFDSSLRWLLRAAGDRGRDGFSWKRFQLDSGRHRGLGIFLANHRATPAPEPAQGQAQPYGGIVHNGTIANAEELGLRPGEIDSMVLPRVLDRANGLSAFGASLAQVRGSYALAAVTERTLLLAANYKPLYYWSPQVPANYLERPALYFSSMARHFASILPFGQAPVKLAPYSVLDALTGLSAGLPRSNSSDALVICSGGLDSTTVAWKLKADGYRVTLLHFDYGCRALPREMARVRALAAALDVDAVFLELGRGVFGSGGGPLLNPGLALADSIPGAEWAHEWVPARNLLMLATATAYAEAHGFHTLAIGNNLEQAGTFPDNEEEFTELFNGLLPHAVQNGYLLQTVSPLGTLMKHEIVALGAQLGVPWDLTWSCYGDGERHCGVCGSCFTRRTAFERNGLKDPVFAEAAACL